MDRIENRLQPAIRQQEPLVSVDRITNLAVQELRAKEQPGSFAAEAKRFFSAVWKGITTFSLLESIREYRISPNLESAAKVAAKSVEIFKKDHFRSMRDFATFSRDLNSSIKGSISMLSGEYKVDEKKALDIFDRCLKENAPGDFYHVRHDVPLPNDAPRKEETLLFRKAIRDPFMDIDKKMEQLFLQQIQIAEPQAPVEAAPQVPQQEPLSPLSKVRQDLEKENYRYTGEVLETFFGCIHSGEKSDPVKNAEVKGGECHVTLDKNYRFYFARLLKAIKDGKFEAPQESGAAETTLTQKLSAKVEHIKDKNANVIGEKLTFWKGCPIEFVNFHYQFDERGNVTGAMVEIPATRIWWPKVTLETFKNILHHSVAIDETHTYSPKAHTPPHLKKRNAG